MKKEKQNTEQQKPQRLNKLGEWMAQDHKGWFVINDLEAVLQ